MPGGFKHGSKAEITVNTKALSLFTDTIDSAIKVASAGTTVFTNTWDTFIPGIAGETVTFSGSWDPTVTTGPAAVLTALIGAAAFPVIVYPAGNIAGSGTSKTFNALLTDYHESSKTTDRVTFSCSLLVTGVDTFAQL